MVQAYLKKCQNSVKVTRKNISYSTLTIPAVSSRKRSKLPTPNQRLQLLAKYTTLNGNKRILLDLPNLVSVDANTHSGVAAAMDSYLASIHPSKRYAADYYTIKDVRQKLRSGTSSLGKRRLYVLIEGQAPPLTTTSS